ncbi:MAG TPA: hypothetical protein VLV18_08735 [Terriglobales bacterium]|nr:hypothetical protein [Terriglobales bacterium]
MQSVSRCPRCGYALRYDRTGYRCDFCGYPNTREPMRTRVRRLERDLRAKVENFIEHQRIPQQQQRWIVQFPPYGTRQRQCEFCGLRIPDGTQTCPYCGKPRTVILPPPNPQYPATNITQMQPGDHQVLDYIASHNGTISLSQAAQDLAISPEVLGVTIERLKAAGFLKSA